MPMKDDPMTFAAIRSTSCLAAALLLAPAIASAAATDIVRHKIPNSDFPIALAVSVPPGATIVLLAIGAFLVLTVIATPLARRRARASAAVAESPAGDGVTVPAVREPSDEATARRELAE